MKTRRLIKTLTFQESDRDSVTLGTGTRIDPERGRLMLTEGALEGVARSRLTNPESVRGWLLFQAETVNRADATGAVVTNFAFRLSDGVTDRWWNGAAWTAATLATDWNSEAEVAENINLFPVANRKLQVVVKLSTSVVNLSPELLTVKVLFLAVIDFYEDVLYRSLVRTMKNEIRAITDLPITIAATSTTIDLNLFPLEAGYEVTSVDSVFNHTSDPDHLQDLFSSYNSGTKVITLSSSIAAGSIAWVRLMYAPAIAVSTSQDFEDGSKFPSLVVAEPRLIEMTETGQDDSVVRKSDLFAVLLPAPLQGDLAFTLVGMTDKAIDAVRLGSAVREFFRRFPLLRSTGLDEPYRLWLVDEFETRTPFSQDEIHSFAVKARVTNMKLWEKDAIDETAVRKIRMNVGGEGSPIDVVPSDVLTLHKQGEG